MGTGRIFKPSCIFKIKLYFSSGGLEKKKPLLFLKFECINSSSTHSQLPLLTSFIMYSRVHQIVIGSSLPEQPLIFSGIFAHNLILSDSSSFLIPLGMLKLDTNSLIKDLK